jgi:hypothetical protein
MSAHGLSAKSPQTVRQAICRKCRRQRDAIVSALGISTVSLESLMDVATRRRITQDATSLPLTEIESVEVDGLHVGRIAMHETIIHFKLTAISEMTKDAEADFRVQLKHVLMAQHATERIIREYNPARVVTYNTHLSTNYVMMLAAERRGVPTFGLHAGGNMADRNASLYLFRQDMVRLYKDWMSRFDKELGSQPSTRQGIVNATRHFLALTTGKTVWVYSAPKSKEYFDVRGYFGVRPEQKVLLATLSSYDELFSSQMMGVMDNYELLFPTQVEWMRALIAHVAKRPDLYLIIRVHPRELPNLRDKLHSTHAKQLAAALTELPPNVRINWPEDTVSLYDLLPHVDVGLNGWSSAGKEVAMLGVPVVIYTSDILYYPSCLNSLANDVDEYFQRIDEALASGWSFERIRQVYRWLAVEYTLGTVDVSDGFRYPEAARSLFRRMLNRLKRELTYRLDLARIRRPLVNDDLFARVLLREEPILDIQLARQGQLRDEEEVALLKSELRKILDIVYSHVPPGSSRTIDALRLATTAD